MKKGATISNLLLLHHSPEINSTFTETDSIDVVLHLLFYFPRKSVFQFLQQFLLAKCMEKGGATISNPLLLLDHSPEINNTFTETDSIDEVLHLLFYFPRKSVFLCRLLLEQGDI